MNKFTKYSLFVGIAAGLSMCSEDFLKVNPKGQVDGNVLANKKGVETLLIGAYSMLDGVADNVGGWEGASSNWVYGSITGGEGNKGTDAGDQPDINPIMNYEAPATNGYFNIRWRSVYEGVSRANSTITVLANASDLTDAERTRYEAEARVLRGNYHFEAKRMWKNIPWVDETSTDPNVGNDLPEATVWANIEADLQFGYDNLPGTMSNKGRVNKYVAGALLAKAKMYQGKFSEALPILNDIINNGTTASGIDLALQEKYGDVFNIAFNNTKEVLFQVQYSVNDGSAGWNGGWGEVLNFPYKSGASPGGCCGFFQPTQEFVNSFRTDANGLPLLDGSYNVGANQVVSDDGKAVGDAFTPDAGNLDPRLDWTVGRRGIPYLDWGKHTGRDWVRDQAYAGPFSPKKQVYTKAQEGASTEVGNWTSGWTANGYRMIRFADIILLAAECEIEAGSLTNARTLINQIRTRAANAAGFVQDGGSPAANYVIGTYTTAFANQTEARKALQMERKLELGMEGHRFFDLVRWGIAKQTIDAFLAYEKPRRPVMYQEAKFDATDIYYPIPQRQIDLSGKLTQNEGYN